MTVQKDRHGHVRHFATNGLAGQFHVDTTPGRDGAAVYLDLPGGWTSMMSAYDRTYDRVIEWLKANPRSPGKTIELAKLGRNTDVRRVLKDAEGNGDLVYTPGPHGSKLWSVKS